jgi:hypothetical protein
MTGRGVDRLADRKDGQVATTGQISWPPLLGEFGKVAGA